ncbi:MAG: YqzE family protein [Sporolactobacillus sp.]
MKSEDYVRFLTEQFVRYLQKPEDERKKAKQVRRDSRLPLRNQLFGQIPDAIESYARNLRRSARKK